MGHTTLRDVSYCDGAPLAGTARISWSGRQSRAKAKTLCYLLSETHTKTSRHTIHAFTKLPISWHSKGQVLLLLGYAPLPLVQAQTQPYPLSCASSQIIPTIIYSLAGTIKQWHGNGHKLTAGVVTECYATSSGPPLKAKSQ